MGKFLLLILFILKVSVVYASDFKVDDDFINDAKDFGVVLEGKKNLPLAKKEDTKIKTHTEAPYQNKSEDRNFSPVNFKQKKNSVKEDVDTNLVEAPIPPKPDVQKSKVPKTDIKDSVPISNQSIDEIPKERREEENKKLESDKAKDKNPKQQKFFVIDENIIEHFEPYVPINSIERKNTFIQKSKDAPIVYSKMIFESILSSDISALKTLIENGADVNYRGKLGYTPLIYAAQNNKSSIVRYLIVKKADLNLRSYDGKTALHFAIKNGNKLIRNILIDSGINFYIKDQLGFTAFDYSKNREQEIFEVASEADTLNKELIVAAKLSGINAINFALNRGANIDYQDTNGNTTLHIAVEENNLSIISLLLIKRANINIRNNKGLTAFELSKQLGHTKAMEIIETVRVERELGLIPENKLTPTQTSPAKKNLVYNIKTYPTQKFLGSS